MIGLSKMKVKMKEKKLLKFSTMSRWFVTAFWLISKDDGLFVLKELLNE